MPAHLRTQPIDEQVLQQERMQYREVTAVERRRVLAFIPMFATSAVFWSLYQQQFTVVTIYFDERVDLVNQANAVRNWSLT